MSIISDKSSKCEEADTKLVALIGNASIQQGNMVMVRLPSGGINIPVPLWIMLLKKQNIIDVIFFCLM